MATGLGYLSYMGMTKQTAFRTPIAATDKVPFISESISEEYARIESDWLDGKAGRRGDEQGPLSVTGSTEIALMHDEVDSSEAVGTDLPLAIQMGAVTWTAGTSTSQFSLAESPSTPATIAFEKTVGIHEIVGAMGKGFTITGSAAGDIRATCDWVCYDYLTTGQTNTSADLNTLPSVIPYRCLFGDMVFRLATDFSDVLAAADQIAISSFTLTYDAAMSDPEFTSALNTASDPYGTVAGKTIKPERVGFRAVTFEITIPRYAVNTWITALGADTAVWADLTITAVATGATGRIMYIFLPYMKVISAPAPISGPDAIGHTITFKCFRGAAYNAGAGNTYGLYHDGSTSVDEEFAIETENDRTDDAFATTPV